MNTTVRRIATVSLAVVLIAALGCETTGQSTALGAAAGAAAGAAIGSQKDKPLEGALIGAAVGGLAGYGVGKVRARKVESEETVSAEHAHVPPTLGRTATAPSGNPSGIPMSPPQEIQAQPAPQGPVSGTLPQGGLLEIEEVHVQPQAVQRGGSVQTSMEYALLGGSGNPVQVTETRVIQQDGKVLQVLSQEAFSRTSGTWLSEFDFRVPQNLPPGTYTLVQQVQVGQAVSSRQTNFRVG